MLLDLRLNDISGKELLKQLKDENLQVPFIVITGQGDERVAVEMMKEGAMDYLVKDATMIDLLPEVVKRTLEQLQQARELVAIQAALRESERALLAISDHEQTRIGIELHDGLGQQLTALELMCSALKGDIEKTAPALAEQITRISQYLREAVGQTRSLARGMAPVKLEISGLSDALADLAQRTAEFGRVSCIFEDRSSVVLKNISAARDLYRIAQESVNNAVKHAQAKEILIRLDNDNSSIRLEISDDGKGFPRSKKAPQGMGLQVMKHRASMIGANLKVDCKPGKGVKVTCVLPLERK